MLSDHCLSCLSVCNVGVLWPNGSMPLGTQVGLGPGHIVLDGDPGRSASTEWGTAASPHFPAYVCCGQTIAHLSNCWALVTFTVCAVFCEFCCLVNSFIVTGDVLGHVKFFDQELKLLNWYFNILITVVSTRQIAFWRNAPSLDLYVCMYPSGKGPAYSVPIRWGLFIAGPSRWPRRGGVWLMMCGNVCMTEGWGGVSRHEQLVRYL